jgi:SAM-dependent methyltransferase
VTTDYYDRHAPRLAATYESIEAARLNAWFRNSLPAAPACVLDIGAGSGRDAAWLTSLGLDVVAVEPSAAMVREARQHHPESPIHWIEGDSLPGLERTLRRGQAFDFILLSAVWMYVPQSERPRAFRKLVSLMKPGARMALTLRHGPPAAGQVIHEVTVAELEKLCRDHGAYIERLHDAVPDAAGRSDLSWTQLILRLPDDGTGALPLLRQVILYDSKSSTYKPALLRALCRIADGVAGMARSDGENHVKLPLGLVALYWLRLFKPLVAGGIPQGPRHSGLQGLSFIGEGYRSIESMSHLDLRIGMQFDSLSASAVDKALRESADCIEIMPVKHITFSDQNAVFKLRKFARLKRDFSGLIEENYLWSLGEFVLPRNIWMAMQRYAVWVEPAIEAEWIRLIGRNTKGRPINPATLSDAMRWTDPERFQPHARRRALELMETAELRCVWTNEKLTARTLAMDHCLPWSIWPCSDLWNLLPAHKDVNGRKSDRVPSSMVLRRCQQSILEWWQLGYCASETPLLRDRFAIEARATLPSIDAAAVTPDEVFSGLLLQQMRLRHDQQVPVWEG